MDVNSIGRQTSPAYSLNEAPDKSAVTASSGTTDATTTATSSDATQKTFSSPVVQIDGPTGAAVLSFRDPSGSEEFQVPSRTALKYEHQQRLEAATHANGDRNLSA